MFTGLVNVLLGTPVLTVDNGFLFPLVCHTVLSMLRGSWDITKSEYKRVRSQSRPGQLNLKIKTEIIVQKEREKIDVLFYS